MKVKEAIDAAYAARKKALGTGKASAAFLASLRANGYAVVPVEPTKAMLRASGIHDDIMSDIYAAMLAAAEGDTNA